MTVNPDEILIVVDEDNKEIGREKRSVVHAKGLWHRTADIWIVNDKGELLCGRRSLKKDKDPGKWEPRFGGHMNVGESFIGGALVEVKEEIGLSVNKKKLKSLGIFRVLANCEYQGQFLYKWNGPINKLKLEEDEVTEVRWFDIDKVDTFFKQNDHNWAFAWITSEVISKIKKL